MLAATTSLSQGGSAQFGASRNLKLQNRLEDAQQKLLQGPEASMRQTMSG